MFPPYQKRIFTDFIIIFPEKFCNMKKIGIEVADKNFRLIKVLYNKKNTRIIIPNGTP